MSAQTMHEAFAPAERKYKAAVMRDTWGHLAPKHRKVYAIDILFAHGDYGDVVPVRVNKGDLDDSPWFFEGMLEFICSRRTSPGNLYKFVGTYALLTNGTHRFSGRVKLARLA